MFLTITRATESRENGANYLGIDNTETFEFCLKSCCQTDLCNLAVWDEIVSGTYLYVVFIVLIIIKLFTLEWGLLHVRLRDARRLLLPLRPQRELRGRRPRDRPAPGN